MTTSRCLFVYGTLIDRDVRRALLGREAMRLGARPATLAGYRRVAEPGASYPFIVPDSRDRVDGYLLDGLRPAALRKLAAYEGNEYHLASCVVEAHGRERRALVFLSRRPVRAGGEWSWTAWRSRHKPALLRRLRALRKA